ncbi:MAG: hypothetical protein AAF206_24855, partial [Bacteroidota bacterium]
KTSPYFTGADIEPQEEKKPMGCFCTVPVDQECVALADVTVKGSVSRVRMTDADCQFCLDEIVEFRVDTVIKGFNGMQVKVKKLAIIQTDMCAFSFAEDSSYIVFGNDVEDEYNGLTFPFITTWQCSGTEKIEPIRHDEAISEGLLNDEAQSDNVFLHASKTDIILMISLLLNLIFIGVLGVKVVKSRSECR